MLKIHRASGFLPIAISDALLARPTLFSGALRLKLLFFQLLFGAALSRLFERAFRGGRQIRFCDVFSSDMNETPGFVNQSIYVLSNEVDPQI